MPRHDRLPIQETRDLLGICRAMFRAWRRDMGTNRTDLAELAEIGRLLRTAIDLAVESSPGSLGHRQAWNMAEDACSRLGRLISYRTPIAPTIQAATGRIRRIGRLQSDRDEKRAVSRKRS